MSNALVLVAGGAGKRMGASIPKQFLLLNGKPILAYAMETFHLAFPDNQIVLVLPEQQFSYWIDLQKECQIHIPHKLVAGGTERFHSVKNGLLALEPCDFVAIHDGVRPLVSADLFKRAFSKVSADTGIVPVCKISSSLRQIDGDENKAISRDNIVTVQTPQAFHLSSLLSCYQQTYQAEFTDDASVWESAGKGIELIEGEEENIKITRQTDLIIASVLQSESGERKAN